MIHHQTYFIDCLLRCLLLLLLLGILLAGGGAEGLRAIFCDERSQNEFWYSVFSPSPGLGNDHATRNNANAALPRLCCFPPARAALPGASRGMCTCYGDCCISPATHAVSKPTNLYGSMLTVIICHALTACLRGVSTH